MQPWNPYTSHYNVSDYYTNDTDAWQDIQSEDMHAINDDISFRDSCND